MLPIKFDADIAAAGVACSDCLMTRADLALYAAKDAGRGASRFFDSSLNAKMGPRHEQVETEATIRALCEPPDV